MGFALALWPTKVRRKYLGAYSLLASVSDFPFVSGAMKIESTKPSRSRPEADNIVGPTPKELSIIGKLYVAAIVPSREMAIDTPTADARTEVGNNSLG